MERDPVRGMQVNLRGAAATTDHHQITDYFRSEDRRRFMENPRQYLQQQARA